MHILTNKSVVSCIIPTRNRADLLKRAIESVIRQSYENLEIIVVNDASEDETDALIEKYMNKERRIKYIRNPIPMGESGARNVGIEMATGDFIALLDDDDQWKKNKIKNQLDAACQFDAVLCAYFDTNEKKSIQHSCGIITQDDIRKNFNFGINSCLLARSNILKRYKYDEHLSFAPDVDLLIRISQNYKVGYVDKVQTIVDTGDHDRITNKIATMTFSQIEDLLYVFHKNKEYFGRFWFKYHEAELLLSCLRKRKDKIKHTVYTIKRCGIFHVLFILFKKRYYAISRRYRQMDLNNYSI